MTKICPVCGDEVGFFGTDVGLGVSVHLRCKPEYNEKIEIYEAEAQIQAEKDLKEQLREDQKQQQRIEDKTVYVEGFNMPFSNLVFFFVKSAIASIPALIILYIIGYILISLFGYLFGALFF